MTDIQLVGTVKKQGVEYVMVRSGISLCLWYAQAAHKLAPVVADILEKYIALIPANSLQTYLSASGVWKKMTAGTLASILREMRSIGVDEYAEFHLGQEPVRNVGRFGAHFRAGPLGDESFPDKINMLYLEFPEDFLGGVPVDRFIEFVRTVASMADFDSGYCGYAFKHLFMSLLDDAFEYIGHKALRYTGFDISSDSFQLECRHKVCNLSWLTLFGGEIIDALGGLSQMKSALPGSEILGVGAGVMVVVSARPIVGDVNRGAPDVAPLRALAKLTKSVRASVDNLGPDDDEFVDRWMSRFDRAQSP